MSHRLIALKELRSKEQANDACYHHRSQTGGLDGMTTPHHKGDEPYHEGQGRKCRDLPRELEPQLTAHQPTLVHVSMRLFIFGHRNNPFSRSRKNLIILTKLSWGWQRALMKLLIELLDDKRANLLLSLLYFSGYEIWPHLPQDRLR